jgi:hypothetical protein
MEGCKLFIVVFSRRDSGEERISGRRVPALRG